MNPAAAALRLERAKELFDEGFPAEALGLLKSPMPDPLSAEREFLTAECCRAQGYFQRSAKRYVKTMASVKPQDDAPLWLDSCLGLASVRRSLGQTDEARRLIAKGKDLARKARLPDHRERLELEEALIDRAQGLYRKSLARLARFLDRFRRRGDWSGAGFVLWATGGARRFSGDLRGSHKDFLRSLAAFKRARDEQGMAYALFGLGGVSRIRGLLRESRKYYAQAEKRLRGTQDLFGQAYAHCGLANVLRQRGALARARAHYLRSHRLYCLLGDKVDLAYVDWGLGKVALQRGDLADAEAYFRRALAAFKRSGEARGEVLSETALALVLHARGRTAPAEALFSKALRRARAAGLHAHLEVFT